MMISRESFKAIKPIYASYNVYRYLRFQIQVAAASFRDWRDRKNPAYAILPPARLRHRVHGSLDKESFLRVGKTLAQNLRDLCAILDRDLYSYEHVLDFGSGCGRVMRNFGDAPASCHLYGSDIDSELVRWCEKCLPHVRWSTNGHLPPLPFSDNSFDLIYAISVFTHLNEEHQHAWLRELRRVARPKAVLILTVHGEHCISNLASSCQSRIHSEGFAFVSGVTGRLKIDKLPDCYQTAYHTEEYVRREWSAYFDVVRYVERGINNHQDAVLLRGPGCGPDEKV